jgi:hypothetical protein
MGTTGLVPAGIGVAPAAERDPDPIGLAPRDLDVAGVRLGAREQGTARHRAERGRISLPALKDRVSARVGR